MAQQMKSRNQREGLYCGTFRANGNPPKKTHRQPYGTGRFITLKEYGKIRKQDAKEFKLLQQRLKITKRRCLKKPHNGA